MHRPWPRLAGAFATIAAVVALAPASLDARQAEAGTVWPVRGKLLGEPTGEGSEAKKSKDVSGIACASDVGFPRICVLADDSNQGAQIVVLHDGHLVAGDFIRLTDASYGGDLLELDAEAVAYADGAFYVMGSHGRPRNKDAGAADPETIAKTAARRQLFRIRFDPASVGADGKPAGPVSVERSLALSDFLRAEPALAPSFDGALDVGGIDIEGVAVRGGRLFAGLRGPVLPDGKAAILSVPVDALFEGAAGQGTLHRLDLGRGRGVRDLAPFGEGFLVLAGPVRDPREGGVADGDYSVAWWDGSGGSRQLGDIPAFGPKVKPEALVPLDRVEGRLRLLVLFDGPPEGAPRSILVDAP